MSLQTALAVIRAFDAAKYEIIPFYITKTGEWKSGLSLSGPVESTEQLTFTHAAGSIESPSVPGALFANTPAVAKSTSIDQAQALSAIDVYFPLLHGTFGEDGTIQGMLEMANVPYVGAGVLSSAVGMDKVMMKKLFSSAGLPQCMYRYFSRNQWEKDREFFLMEIEIALGYPCFVKPANLGSSVGISKARNRDELIGAVAEAFRYDRKVIVEEFVDAREIEVAVLGNDEPQASVPGEIVSGHEFYDYRAKYSDGTSTMIIPAELSSEMAHQLREMAVSAFQAIEASGLSRVDFFVRRESGDILLNEINTMPGFTPHSMYPLLWKETGKSYQQLLDELIALALARHEEKQSIHYTFDE